MPEVTVTEPIVAPKTETPPPPPPKEPEVKEPEVTDPVEIRKHHATPLPEMEEIDFTTATAGTVVEILTKAKEAGVEDFDKVLAQLRAKRKVGSFHIDPRGDGGRYRDENSVLTVLDETVVILAKTGHIDIVKALLSSNPRDIPLLGRKIDSTVADMGLQAEIKGKIKEQHVAKQNELSAILTSHGLGIEDQRIIVLQASDPDSCREVSGEFWKEYATYPKSIKDFYAGSGDLVASAKIYQMINAHGLMSNAALGLQRVLRTIITPEHQSAYLENYKKMTAMIPEQPPGKKVISKKRLEEMMARRGITTAKPEQFMKALLTLKPFYDKSGYVDLPIHIVNDHVQYMADPEAFAQSIVEAFNRAKRLLDKDLVYGTSIALSEDPGAFVDALFVAENVLKDRRSLRERLHLESRDKKIHGGENLTTYAKAHLELQKQGASLEAMSEEEWAQLDTIVEENRGRDVEVFRYIRDRKIVMELDSLYALFVEPVITSGNTKDGDRSKTPTLDKLPALMARFTELGIDSDTAQQIFNSWRSYRALSHKLDRDGATDFNFDHATKEQVEYAKLAQSRMFRTQVEAITTYAELYGKDELGAVIRTFGIYNFNRYGRNRLHEQINSWQNGEKPVRNVVVVARSDWNSSLKTVGVNMASALGVEGLYFFEANDPTEIAKAAVKIGDRERKAHREPTVENFVIEAHANPKGLSLGVKNEGLTVRDYVEEKRIQQEANLKINDYRKHLGKKFRVILKACETAGETYGKNISTAIGEGHRVRTEASSELTIGAIIIGADNSVIFNITKDGKNEQMPSSTYFPPDFAEDPSFQSI